MTDEEIIAEIRRLEAEIDACHNDVRRYHEQIDDLYALLRSRTPGFPTPPAPEES